MERITEIITQRKRNTVRVKKQKNNGTDKGWRSFNNIPSFHALL
jgi:hypothetical protein